MSDYNNYNYFAPSRPEGSIPPVLISYYENKGWVGQIKKNGCNNMLFISPERKLLPMTRHATEHKMWKPTEASSVFVNHLPDDGKWYVLNAELLHSKTKNVKDTNFIFDIYIHCGKKLTNLCFLKRQELLFNLFKNNITGETNQYWIINKNTWLAKSFSNNLLPLYKSLNSIEDEGIVLKNTQATFASKVWQVKCRKAHKNYSF